MGEGCCWRRQKIGWKDMNWLGKINRRYCWHIFNQIGKIIYIITSKRNALSHYKTWRVWRPLRWFTAPVSAEFTRRPKSAPDIGSRRLYTTGRGAYNMITAKYLFDRRRMSWRGDEDVVGGRSLLSPAGLFGCAIKESSCRAHEISSRHPLELWHDVTSRPKQLARGRLPGARNCDLGAMFRTWLRLIVVPGVTEADVILEDGLRYVQWWLDAIHPASRGCLLIWQYYVLNLPLFVMHRNRFLTDAFIVTSVAWCAHITMFNTVGGFIKSMIVKGSIQYTHRRA